MTYALTCSASSIFQADSPVESDVPLKPASMRIFPSSLQIGSTWITNVQPYGPEDGYIFSTREHCGLSILHSQNMQVSKLTGIIQENTKLLAASKQNVIAQVTSNGTVYAYRQSAGIDGPLTLLLKHSLSVLFTFIVSIIP